jgi:hypothetical protein
MTFAPGHAKVGGRKKGVQPKAELARLERLRELAEKLTAGSGSFNGDASALLTAVYKSPELPLALRLDCAKAIMAFERPRLSQVDVTYRSVDRMTDENFFRAWDNVARFLAERGRPKLLEATAGAAPVPTDGTTGMDNRQDSDVTDKAAIAAASH